MVRPELEPVDGVGTGASLAGRAPSVATVPEVLTFPDLDVRRAEAAVRELLLAVGEDPDRKCLRETRASVAPAYQEILAGLFADPGGHARNNIR